MNKTTRRNLIKQLVLTKKTNGKNVAKSQKKSEVKADFIAFTEPTEVDVLEELSRLDGFNAKD